MKNGNGWRNICSPAVFVSRHPALFPLCLLLSIPAAAVFLFRDLWFDEALTVLNFASAESVNCIYHSYVIPNNQILYTIALHFWMDFFCGFCSFDLWLRLLSLFYGTILLLFLWYFFRRRLGALPLFLTLAAFGFSTAYGIYATAVRGYMQSALLVCCTLGAALRLAESGRSKYAVLYFLCCTATLGTIPSNLAALAGGGLYVMPVLGRKFYLRPRFYALALLPFAGGALFYLPILTQFLGVTKLREGWSEGYLTVSSAGAAVVWSFGLLSVLALAGGFACRFRTLWRGAIWLLPVPAALLLPTAPFPRVYFPLFPLFGLLVAGNLRSFAARWRLKRKKRPGWAGAAGVLFFVLLWSVVSRQTFLREPLSGVCGGAGRDDYFYSHYLRPDFQPVQTARELRKYCGENTVLYHSFASDPWAVMFALRLQQSAVPLSVFDGPRGPVPALPDGALLVLRTGENVTVAAERFSGRAELLCRTPMHEIYRFSK